MIKSVKGLQIGQDFYHNGVKYIVKSFPDRYNVIGKCTKILSDAPLTIKVEICDIKRAAPLSKVQRELFISKMDEVISEPGVTLYDLHIAMKKYFSITQYNPEAVAKAMSRASGFTITQLKAKNRKRGVVLARQICFYYLWKQGAVLADAGAYFGGKDHATVLFGRNNIMGWLEQKQKATVDLYNKFIKEIEK